MSDEPRVRPARGNGAPRPRLGWHRRIGIWCAALFVVVVATGLLLNHAEDLGLRQRVLHADWLYRWYGMQPAGEPVGFPAGDRWVIGLDGGLYLDTSVLPAAGVPVGAVTLDEMFVIATADEVVVITPEGNLVERLSRAARPPGVIRRLGLLGDDVALETDAGTYQAGVDLLTWEPVGEAARVRVHWSEPARVPPALARDVVTAFRGEGITVHRLVLDLHSGRFLGGFGVVLVDVAALALLFLALSGTAYAWRTRRRERERERP
jgi:hypothetical protein